MRQVPTDRVNALPFVPSSLLRPLLIGRGKLARHLYFYFNQLGFEPQQFLDARSLIEFSTARDALAISLRSAGSIWLLTSDSSLNELARVISPLAQDLPILHCSAATAVEGAATLHPLMTFGPELYPSENYAQIPFAQVGTSPARTTAYLEALTERLPNPLFKIADSDRTFYHALCMMMANLPQILWNAVEQQANAELQMSPEYFNPILRQATQNFIAQGAAALTGPLIRGDQATIEKHLYALSNNPLRLIYQSFIEFYQNGSLPNRVPGGPHDHRPTI